jgi:hypothetical protein
MVQVIGLVMKYNASYFKAIFIWHEPSDMLGLLIEISVKDLNLGLHLLGRSFENCCDCLRISDKSRV